MSDLLLGLFDIATIFEIFLLTVYRKNRPMNQIILYRYSETIREEQVAIK